MRIAMIALCAAALAAQSLQDFVGTWAGELEGAPAVKLRIDRKDGKLDGDITFYLIKREGGVSRVAGHNVEPMRDLEVKGGTATFKVRNRDNEILPFEFVLGRDGEGVVKKLAAEGVEVEVRVTRGR